MARKLLTLDLSLEELKDSIEGIDYQIKSTTSSTDMTAKVIATVSLDRDTKNISLFIVNTSDGYNVTVFILSNVGTGISHIPLLGDSFMSIDSQDLLAGIPMSVKDKMNAINYLTQNPELLIGKLTTILTSQTTQIQALENENYNIVDAFKNVYPHIKKTASNWIPTKIKAMLTDD